MASAMGCSWICKLTPTVYLVGSSQGQSANCVIGRLIRVTEDPIRGILLPAFGSCGLGVVVCKWIIPGVRALPKRVASKGRKTSRIHEHECFLTVSNIDTTNPSTRSCATIEPYKTLEILNEYSPP